ncbi:hypothetical protein [Lewinella sp. JB7]|uniref:hypothetical protein n=1 Tax=Lewinella sp. JB7 TaxID=2962887 RepID=UPI0020C96E77|nr:hypothetical protein [Lewinella sp. JB7]MCP9237757.1 hypothetical protein [Lewinella sp. JB7]
MPPPVRLLRRDRIDNLRWDHTVTNDARPLPYALSWWLDTVTDGCWDGLVYGDYLAVLPLPRLHRFGFLPAILRPAYTQQLGPFGSGDPDIVRALLDAIPRSFQLALPLRPDLPERAIPERFSRRRRVNYVLGLERPFTELANAFPRKLQAYLRKCESDRLVPITPADLVAVSRRELAGRDGLRSAHFTVLEKLIATATDRGYGSSYALYENQELLAVGFYPELGGRTINLAAASTPLGRKRRGMSRLLALVMRERAGTAGAVFDFEGSELPGVGAFFAKFGAYNEGYWIIEERLFGLR